MDWINIAQDLDASRNWVKHAIGSAMMFLGCLRRGEFVLSAKIWWEYERRWRNHETPFS